MFGKNPLRPQNLDSSKGLQVESLFYTIQGEGPLSGIPAVFIRLAGCPLRCYFCDTQFETGIDNWVLPNELSKQVALLSKKARLVVLTGGEPLRQDILPLCGILKTYGYHVQIETAGVMWVPCLEDLLTVYPYPGVSIVVSPKAGKVVREVAESAQAWKYIISAGGTDPEDGLPNMSTQAKGKKQRIARPPPGTDSRRIYLQPCDEYDVEKNKNNRDAVAQLAMQFGYRVSIQTHKILGLE